MIDREENFQLRERVEREIYAHEENDVLKNSYKLKRLFRHIETCETAIRFEHDFKRELANVTGMRILEMGCGYGEESRALLKAGAYVVGIDISKKYILECRSAAARAGFSEERYSFHVMDAHELSFAPESFDMVVGRGILHHLDLDVCLGEIRRVLRPGGRALFHEPLGDNPLLKLFRIITPGARTVDERPLTRRDLENIRHSWEIESSYYGLISAPLAIATSILLRPFNNNVILRMGDRMEQWVNRKVIFQPFNQYVLLNLIRPK